MIAATLILITTFLAVGVAAGFAMSGRVPKAGWDCLKMPWWWAGTVFWPAIAVAPLGVVVIWTNANHFRFVQGDDLPLEAVLSATYIIVFFALTLVHATDPAESAARFHPSKGRFIKLQSVTSLGACSMSVGWILAFGINYSPAGLGTHALIDGMVYSFVLSLDFYYRALWQLLSPRMSQRFDDMSEKLARELGPIVGRAELTRRIARRIEHNPLTNRIYAARFRRVLRAGSSDVAINLAHLYIEMFHFPEAKRLMREFRSLQLAS